METSQILLNNGLTFLAVATGIMLVVVGGFLIKLIIDLSKLAQNVDETTTVVRNELQLKTYLVLALLLYQNWNSFQVH